jgi:hypothetical protein
MAPRGEKKVRATDGVQPNAARLSLIPSPFLDAKIQGSFQIFFRFQMTALGWL